MDLGPGWGIRPQHGVGVPRGKKGTALGCAVSVVRDTPELQQPDTQERGCSRGPWTETCNMLLVGQLADRKGCSLCP